MSTGDTTNSISISPPGSDEPASQWARSTLSALDTEHTNTTGQPPSLSSNSYPYSVEKVDRGFTQHTPDSPGVKVPGAFPGASSQAKDVGGNAQNVKQTALDALETAKGYAYNAGGVAKEYAQSAGQAVGEYIPPSVSAYFPGGLSKESHEYSLPSQETSSNEHPFTSGGVGTLPGPANEPSVALLPDERNKGTSTASSTGASKTQTSPIITTTNNGSVAPPISSIPQPQATSAKEKEINNGGIPETMCGETSVAKLPEERRQDNLFSHDGHAATAPGKTGGVGVLPSPTSNAGAAKLPEAEEVRQKNLPSHGLGGVSAIGTTAGVGVLPGSKSELGGAKLPDKRAHLHPPTQEKVVSAGSGTDGASTDASTRSLAGSRVVPTGSHGAAFTGLGSPESQMPIHHDAPKADAREHPLATDEEKKFAGNVFKKQSAGTVTPPRVSSDIATPGHEYPPSGTKGGAVGAGAGGLAGAGGRRGSEGMAEHDHRKSGFMDKLKGEMKVISGKLGHNEEKVEAGRKMMGKN
ncbi:unnamed protein product [Cyclocybe aegerita]|uniref:Uncharacterized protein n=1 Tax=Cyclocybe aegerita TaxID=1973307 RepID=A0A8S0WJP7_CYCAE|nr:unnamed protein product [Cyclocybe aegerita]